MQCPLLCPSNMFTTENVSHNHKLSSSQYSWNVLSDAGPPILQLPTTKQIAFNIIVNRCQFLADHSQDDLCLLPAPIQENDGKFVGARSYHDLLHILDNLWPWSWIRVSCRSPCFVELQYVGQNRWKIMFSFSVSHNQIITASCRFFFRSGLILGIWCTTMGRVSYKFI